MTLRAALLLCLVASTALAEGRIYARDCEVSSRRSGRGGVACATADAGTATSYAFFEFAPANGAGMGAACACTTPTGRLGETLTFARASTAWCTKGNETSGLAVGDLVECASDQPRVMRGGAGTGGLGLAVWMARTNVALRSTAFDNVAWADFTAGTGTAPVRGAADQDVAPDGTTTAERVTFAATGASASSGLSQTVLTAAAYSGSVYAQGNATTGSGSFDLCLDTAASTSCGTCTFVLATATRCEKPNVTSKASGIFYIGNLSSLNGGTTRAAVTPTLWMAQAEAGTTVGPPITTAGTAATRVAETPSIATPTGVSATGCIGVTVTTAAATIPEKFMLAVRTAFAYGIYGDTTNKLYMYDGTNGPVSAGTVSRTSPLRLTASWSSDAGTQSGAASTGATVAGAFDGLMWGNSTTLQLGGFADGTYKINGVLKQLKIDTTTTGCQ